MGRSQKMKSCRCATRYRQRLFARFLHKNSICRSGSDSPPCEWRDSKPREKEYKLGEGHKTNALRRVEATIIARVIMFSPWQSFSKT